MDTIGRRKWAIPEGYIPSESRFSDRALISHDTACILNVGDRNAKVTITIYFADREPVGPYKISVGARRTLHGRFNDLDNPQPIPRDTPRSWNPTCPSSCNIRGSTRAPGLRCFPRLHMRTADSDSDPKYDNGTFFISIRLYDVPTVKIIQVQCLCFDKIAAASAFIVSSGGFLDELKRY